MTDLPPEIHTLIDVVETMMLVVVELALQTDDDGNSLVSNRLYLELVDARTTLERLRQQ